MKKILAVLVNYGDEQLNYLKQVVDELKSFKKYKVTIIVHSNIDLDIELIDKVNIYQLEDYQLLPLTCRKTIWENRNDYELFIYGENDHLFLEKHIDKHLEYTAILPKNKIPGLIQFEEKDGYYYYPAYHADFDWDFKSVKVYDNKIFAHFNNVHQASFILTKQQLLNIGSKINFVALVNEKTFLATLKRKLKKRLGFKLERENKYSVKCKVNTDIYLYGGMEKLICISEFKDNIIHHLPNLYVEGEKGRNKLRSDDKRMKNSLSQLLKQKM
ncbi:hypothetical protein GV828_06415 [Flavobacterium sp. NST-5]|uniref:Glycosyltransferase 2-like domain-containing protein n=1 Tax=Flavobacterium ichthyis TaxID=2698827 RepID=A0ABW9Z7I2_9FLAO|nr:hypothetical protein [Flavobacterium ichthyis]NBL64832.1 hypothetical protein [Flavobacterium ichthyis]